jgi:hypothetical protein
MEAKFGFNLYRFMGSDSGLKVRDWVIIRFGPQGYIFYGVWIRLEGFGCGYDGTCNMDDCEHNAWTLIFRSGSDALDAP